MKVKDNEKHEEALIITDDDLVILLRYANHHKPWINKETPYTSKRFTQLIKVITKAEIGETLPERLWEIYAENAIRILSKNEHYHQRMDAIIKNNYKVEKKGNKMKQIRFQ